jgi:signal transduction histidine kinase
MTTLGNSYFKLKDYSLALGYQKRALKYAQLQKDHRWIAYIALNLANVYVAKKQYSSAINFLLEGYGYAHEFKTYSYLFSICSTLGHVYQLQRKYDKAKNYYDEAFMFIKYSQKITLCKFYEAYSTFCSEIGNFVELQKYLTKCHELNMELYNEDLVKQTAILTAKFDAEQRDKDLEIYRLKNVELLDSQNIIKRKNDELVSLQNAKDNILEMISSGLKNYVITALSAHETMIQDDISLASNKHAKIIRESCHKALNLLKDIMEVNKIDLSTEDILYERINIHDIIDPLIQGLRYIAQKKHIEIIYKSHPKDMFCNINKEQIQRVLDNLIYNAIKFTPYNGKVYIRTNLQENLAQISIIDSGIGMDAELIEKLFRQYSKTGRKGTAGEESTGLGLYMVKAILDKHNATIEVTSEVAKGSEFTIKIPVATC